MHDEGPLLADGSVKRGHAGVHLALHACSDRPGDGVEPEEIGKVTVAKPTCSTAHRLYRPIDRTGPIMAVPIVGGLHHQYVRI